MDKHKKRKLEDFIVIAAAAASFGDDVMSRTADEVLARAGAIRTTVELAFDRWDQERTLDD